MYKIIYWIETAKYKKALETVKANYATFEVPYYGLDNNDYCKWFIYNWASKIKARPIREK